MKKSHNDDEQAKLPKYIIENNKKVIKLLMDNIDDLICFGNYPTALDLIK